VHTSELQLLVTDLKNAGDSLPYVGGKIVPGIFFCNHLE